MNKSETKKEKEKEMKIWEKKKGRSFLVVSQD